MMLGPHRIVSAPSVKLLGVHIDRELRWKEQGAVALAKRQAWLARVARLARPSRGIKAEQMRSLYLSTCVPRMMHAADIFLNPTSVNTRTSPNRGILGRLRTIQRRPVLANTGALSSIPTDVLDTYAGLLPIRHLPDKLRYGAAMRLATLPETHPLYTATNSTSTWTRCRRSRQYRKGRTGNRGWR